MEMDQISERGNSRVTVNSDEEWKLQQTDLGGLACGCHQVMEWIWTFSCEEKQLIRATLNKIVRTQLHSPIVSWKVLNNFPRMDDSDLYRSKYKEVYINLPWLILVKQSHTFFFFTVYFTNLVATEYITENI